MAIARHSSGNTYFGSNADPQTLTGVDVGSGSNRFLLVSITTNTTPSDYVSGVTYAGVSMTRVATYLTTNANVRIYIYALHAPTTGSNSVVVDLVGATDCDIHYAAYTGVNQASAVDNTANSAVAGTTPSISLTSVADNCWFYCAVRNNAAVVNASTGANALSSGTRVHGSFDSNSAKTPAGSYTMNFTANGGSTSWMSIVSFAPAVDAPTFTPIVSYVM